MYSIPFWSKTYRYVSSIRNDNRVKWVQFQIVRNSQFTNYKVNKFNPNVSALCSYCKEAEELVSHLYYRCPVVQNFWKELKLFMANLGLMLSLGENSILFGDKKKSPDSMVNVILLWAKYYIWTNKFKSTHRRIIGFKAILEKRLQDFKELCTYDESYINSFNQWIPLYLSLNAGNGGI